MEKEEGEEEGELISIKSQSMDGVTKPRQETASSREAKGAAK